MVVKSNGCPQNLGFNSGSHMHKCVFNLGLRAVSMLQAPRHLNPALLSRRSKYSDKMKKLICFQ